jgi:type I restriction enzyme R subunit
MALDFVNEQKDIEASFQDYYQRTELEGATDPNKLSNLKYTLEHLHVFTAEDLVEFVDLFVVKKVKSEKLQPFFQRIVTGKGSDGSIVRNNYYDNLATEHIGTKDYEKLKASAKDKFRKELGRYVKQYSFISQIMTFTDTGLEKFYLFAKLLIRQLPYEIQTLPLEVMEMIDMDNYRVQEEQNGRITLQDEDGVLIPPPDDGHRSGEVEKEKLKLIVKKLNEDFGIPFEEADRVMSAIKAKLEEDDGLRAAFKTNSIEFLRKQKLQDSIKDAFLSNADEFLSFMSKTETDSGFGKFFFSEMFKWYEGSMKAGKSSTE